MAENQDRADSQSNTHGMGTQGVREAEKAAGSQGADTRAAGVPAPQSGGPESPQQNSGQTGQVVVNNTPTAPPTAPPTKGS